MMQSVLGNTSKVLIDQKNSGNLMSLPLDRLLQQGAAASSQTAQDASSTSRAPVATPDASVTIDASRRDALRNREGR